MPLTDIQTLRDLHNARKWNFFEKGLQTLWNEYAQIIDAVIEGAGASMPTGITDLGAADLGANFDPDAAPLLPIPDQGLTPPPTNFRT